MGIIDADRKINNLDRDINIVDIDKKVNNLGTSIDKPNKRIDNLDIKIVDIDKTNNLGTNINRKIDK